MEGSVFSILPLLFLIFLCLPAIVPNFTGRLHLVLEKLVQFWGRLNEGYRKGVSLWDFIFSHPVVQLPICMVGGSSATAYLVQFLGRKELILETNSINYIIIGGLNYISLYIFILIIQFSIFPIMQTLGKIRGKKSGLSPQRSRWNFSEVDFAFLWAGILTSFGSPLLEWAIKFHINAGFLSVGWANLLVGNLCWLLIFVLIRLTVFLPSQHNKSKLLTLAIIIALLSLNCEDCQIAGNNPAALKMATSYNIQFPRCIMAFKMEQQFSSMLIKGNFNVKQRVVDSPLTNQLTKINGHCNLLGLTNPHRNFGRPLIKILHSDQLDPRRNCGTQQPLQYRIRSLQQQDKKTIKKGAKSMASGKEEWIKCRISHCQRGGRTHNT